MNTRPADILVENLGPVGKLAAALDNPFTFLFKNSNVMEASVTVQLQFMLSTGSLPTLQIPLNV